MDDEQDGNPEILEKLETEQNDSLPTDAPDGWSKDEGVRDFILEWLIIEPLLGGIDLRAAIYLSRETMPSPFR